MELAEILDALRGGMPPNEVYRMGETTEPAIRARVARAGMMDEFRAALKANRLYRSQHLDIERVMVCADRGMTLTSACIDMGVQEGIVRDRLFDDDRWVEFNARYMSARRGSARPVVSPEGYHDGPRTVLTSAMAHIPESDRSSFREAIARVDAMVRDGGELSRLCWGESACTRS